jgi:hypothetical protein
MPSGTTKRKRVSASTQPTLCHRRVRPSTTASCLASASGACDTSKLRASSLSCTCSSATRSVIWLSSDSESVISWRWRDSMSAWSDSSSQIATDTVNSTDSSSGTHHQAPRRASVRAQVRPVGAPGVALGGWGRTGSMAAV